MSEYNFQYIPLEGKLPGLTFEKQTEDAINDLGNRIASIDSGSESAVTLAESAVASAAAAVETANNANTTAGTALTTAQGINNIHFVGVNSTDTTDDNYNGGGATGTDSIAIGDGATVSGNNSVSVGSGSTSTGNYEFSVGNTSNQRRIINVAPATAGTDAVTKSQMETAISAVVPGTVGSATQPVYYSSGTATACTYSLAKSVPANAVFTDTTYSSGNGISIVSDVVSLRSVYCVCDTASGTTAKEADLSDFELYTGVEVTVLFSNAVDAGSTLNVNATGDKDIYYNGAAIGGSDITAGMVVKLVYDGTQYRVIGKL